MGPKKHQIRLQKRGTTPARRRLVFLFFILLLVPLLMLLVEWTTRASGEQMRRSAVIVECTSQYALVRAQDTLCRFADSVEYRAGCWVNRFPLIPSCHGRVATVLPKPPVRFVGANALCDSIVRQLRSEKRRYEDQQGELAYFMSMHRIYEEGYDMVAKRSSRVKTALDSVARLLATFEQAAKRPCKIVQTARYRIVYELQNGKRVARQCQLSHTTGQGIHMLQLNSQTTPANAHAVDYHGLPWGLWGDRWILIPSFAALDVEEWASRTAEGVLTKGELWGKDQHDVPTILSADGSPVFSEKGQLLGIVKQGRICPWRLVLRRFDSSETSAQYRYAGSRKGKKYEGWGELAKGDSVVYSGQWRAGKRHGRGMIADRRGRKIVGWWHDDTLVSGRRTAEEGVYEGELSAAGTAHGYGVFTDSHGNGYEGHWDDDRRSGFGYALSSEKGMQIGQWRNDKYLGERMTYTSDRIYGIDLSKYQHQVGRKKFSIQWHKLRIVDLGKLSKKNIRGKVDYPVSFVFIKATEGTTVKNPYYAADYRAARAHTIHCGSYHFFSTHSPAAAQARFFIKNAKFSKGDFPPVLDVEPTDRQIEQMGGPQAMFQQLREWLAIVERHTRVKPILYVSQQFVNQYLPLAPDLKSKYRVWIARYGEYKPDVRLLIWQLSPDGRVEGIRTEVDINVFNGYQLQFDQFLRTGLIP